MPIPLVLCFVQVKQVKLKEKMSQMRQGWGGKGKDLIGGFMSLFGRDGRIVSQQ